MVCARHWIAEFIKHVFPLDIRSVRTQTQARLVWAHIFPRPRVPGSNLGPFERVNEEELLLSAGEGFKLFDVEAVTLATLVEGEEAVD